MTTSRLNQEVFDDWLSDQPPEHNTNSSLDIRDAIIASGHNFAEGIKWGTPGYWLPEISRRNIVYIAPHSNYVRLGFFNGATMPDPNNLSRRHRQKTPPHQKSTTYPISTDSQTLTTLRQPLRPTRHPKPRLPLQLTPTCESLHEESLAGFRVESKHLPSVRVIHLTVARATRGGGGSSIVGSQSNSRRQRSMNACR